MPEKKCFSWLDARTKPADKIVVVDACLETLGVELDQDLEQSEVEIFLFCRAEVLGERFSGNVASVVIIDRQKRLPD